MWAVSGRWCGLVWDRGGGIKSVGRCPQRSLAESHPTWPPREARDKRRNTNTRHGFGCGVPIFSFVVFFRLLPYARVDVRVSRSMQVQQWPPGWGGGCGGTKLCAAFIDKRTHHSQPPHIPSRQPYTHDIQRQRHNSPPYQKSTVHEPLSLSLPGPTAPCKNVGSKSFPLHHIRHTHKHKHTHLRVVARPKNKPTLLFSRPSLFEN